MAGGARRAVEQAEPAGLPRRSRPAALRLLPGRRTSTPTSRRSSASTRRKRPGWTRSTGCRPRWSGRRSSTPVFRPACAAASGKRSTPTRVTGFDSSRAGPRGVHAAPKPRDWRVGPRRGRGRHAVSGRRASSLRRCGGGSPPPVAATPSTPPPTAAYAGRAAASRCSVAPFGRGRGRGRGPAVVRGTAVAPERTGHAAERALGARTDRSLPSGSAARGRRGR
ncbi:hypothetical protein SAFG77S_04621 [Streptomyces afghaniensis]